MTHTWVVIFKDVSAGYYKNTRYQQQRKERQRRLFRDADRHENMLQGGTDSYPESSVSYKGQDEISPRAKARELFSGWEEAPKSSKRRESKTSQW